MENFPGYVAAWADARQLFDSLHELWGETAELAAESTAPFRDDSVGRKIVLEHLRNLDELLRQPRFVAASMHWGEYDEANDYWGGCTDSEAEHALYGYSSELRLLVKWCQSLLIELNFGTEECNVEFWPRTSRYIWSLRRRMEAVVNSFQKLPEVRAELLRLARGSDRPVRPPVAENSLDGANNGANNLESANSSKLFPKGVPEDPDIRDLVLRLQVGGKSQNEIARQFTGGDEKRAKKLLARIRMMRSRGQVNL